MSAETEVELRLQVRSLEAELRDLRKAFEAFRAQQINGVTVPRAYVPPPPMPSLEDLERVDSYFIPCSNPATTAPR